MTAPTKARPRPDTRTRPSRPTRSRVASPEAPSTAPREARDGGGRARSSAAQRGYARRAQRKATVAVRRRMPFVLLMMALLALGLITSLWLSTASAADSYRLDEARVGARDLSEQAERLRQDVAAMQTAPELAQRASELGLVPAEEPARLVLLPDGTVQLVGTPAPATKPAPPPAPQQPDGDDDRDNGDRRDGAEDTGNTDDANEGEGAPAERADGGD